MKTAVVICPGRGTYNKNELGYLQQHFPNHVILDKFDSIRKERGQDSVTALDRAKRYSPAIHGRGDNASALIYAAILGDFISIDNKKVEIVAVTGNSMGWYSALACAGALSLENGFRLANMMGTYMQDSLIGGQIIYPYVDEEWTSADGKRQQILSHCNMINQQQDHTLYLSIDLGGMLVLAGNEKGLKAFENSVENIMGKFPMRLNNHAAFHTELQNPIARIGRQEFPSSLFEQSSLPLIDGSGSIWWPQSYDSAALHDYTLGAQVTQSYNFTHAITIAAREFAPDYFIITGPGTTLGGAVAQSLILSSWHDMRNKSDFQKLQTREPFLVSMAMDQRELVT